MDVQIFSLAEADNLSLVGGKAYALSKMMRAGFTIPDGFVLSAQAFQKMTPDLEKLLLEYFDALQADSVAVRSSAINEDGSEAAWAGQLDTFLHCPKDMLISRIQACWDSARSARAQAYAAQKSLPHTDVAALIQKMVPSEVSGVAFSVHPISQDDTKVVIEAGLGLGEAVVSGQITPDTYIVRKHSGEHLETFLAPQTKMLVRSPGGETTWQGTGKQGNDQKLSASQITDICKLTADLEHFFGYPVDVEWAISKGTLYVLQCRAITTL